jgi:4-amino-4-deoxy-L-arabinose transferase-like glycosyltransferase
MNSSSPFNSKRTLWVLALSFVAVWLYMLGARTLVPTDEGRYAEMGREMFMSGDWITPRLNDIKYFYKPPLQNWMNALTYNVFGLGDWQARLWTGLCGLFGIAIAAYTAAKIYSRRIGITTALVLGGSFYWAALGHVNSLDMGLASMMTFSLCGLLLAQRDGVGVQEQRNAMLLCWAGMALATMSKGLIGFVLPGAVLVIYTLITRDWMLWTRLHLGKGLLLFFAITAPWFILVWQANPEHPHFFFIHEHFQRFTSDVHKRGGPWHYFFPIFIIGIFPWIISFAPALWSGMKKETSQFQPKLMLTIWTVFIFFFFSISGSKLPSYILPIFPSLAILLAIHFEASSFKALRINAIIMLCLGLLGFILAPKIGALAKFPYELPFYQAMVPWVLIACAACVISALLAFYVAPRNRDWALISIAFGAYLAGQGVFLGHDAWGKYNAGIYHLDVIKAQLKAETKIYAVGLYEQALPFYLERTLILVEHPDEMAFGLMHEPDRWVPKQKDFVKLWNAQAERGEKSLAIIRPREMDKLKQLGIKVHIIAEDPKRIIVSNL